MLQKIIKIQGIGLLHNPLPTGAIELSRMTVVYAENGRGKSTFAAICRSLAIGESDLLIDKKTISGSFDQELQFLIDGDIYQYIGGAWNNSFEKLLVFDDLFVEKNVSLGSRVDATHRENLLKFAIGEKGVELKNEIDDINQQIDNLNRRRREIEKALKAIAKPYSIEDFVRLSPSEKIDIEIDSVKQQLQDAKNIASIRNRPKPRQVSLPQFDLTSAKSLLHRSLDTITADVEKVVEEHISSHLDDAGEDWLRQGVRYLGEKDECPFCGQRIEGLDIIKAYSDYFNKAYEFLKLDIEKQQDDFRQKFSRSAWTTFRDRVEFNRQTFDAWSDKLKFSDNLDMSLVKHAFDKLIKITTSLLEQKRLSPLDKVDTSVLETVVEQYNKALDKIQEYNSSIENYNKQIQGVLDSLDRIDQKALEDELDRLRAQKKRMERDTDKLCQEYEDILNNKLQLEDNKKRKKAELESYTHSILDKYKNSINAVLKKFNANFQIEKIDLSHHGGTPRSEYVIKILRELIRVGSRSGPGLGTILSSGDRKTLALAFFLARLHVDFQEEGLQYIVIVDDPVSSLDMGRRRATIDELASLTSFSKQLIVLSHDPTFLRDLLERSESRDHLQLQLRRKGKYSIFDTCDIYQIVQDEYFQIYQELLDYIKDGPQDDNHKRKVAADIRKYLEHNLRTRFPLELAKTRNLGEMLGRIRSNPHKFGTLQNKMNELNAINEFSSQYHHAAASTYPPSDSELMGMVQRALEIGRG